MNTTMYRTEMYAKVDIDKPVEQVFNAIFQLQILEEYDHITHQLKEELVKLFEEIPEKDGKKRLHSVAYYPNGLCTWDNKTDKIHLTQWENKTETKKKQSNNYAVVKHFNLIWYMQFMLYLKKPIRLRNEIIHYRKVKSFMEEYDKLPETQQRLLLHERNDYNQQRLEDECKKIIDILSTSSRYSTIQYVYRAKKIASEFTEFVCLSDDQLDALKHVYEHKNVPNNQFDYEVQKILWEFAKKESIDREKQTIIDLSDLLRPTIKEERERDAFYYKYVFDFDTIEEAFLAIAEKFAAVEDETLQKIFKKLEITN